MFKWTFKLNTFENPSLSLRYRSLCVMQKCTMWTAFLILLYLLHEGHKIQLVSKRSQCVFAQQYNNKSVTLLLSSAALSSLSLAIIQLNSSQASAALAVRGRFLDARREGELQRELIERAMWVVGGVDAMFMCEQHAGWPLFWKTDLERVDSAFKSQPSALNKNVNIDDKYNCLWFLKLGVNLYNIKN